ncbi:MAG: hypothetical protein KJO82_14655, partial [Gammaproteobacteria bacterium]|nr:hypothetical protein [Gammaproteobacteria bacterium]
MPQSAGNAIALPAFALLLLACAPSEQSGDADGNTAARGDRSVDLSAKLAAASRPAEDRERDIGRKPAEVIRVLGITPGMDVIDIMAAGGWYTEVLSIAVGPDGSVTAMNPPRVLSMREGANEKALSRRLAGNRLTNVSRLDKDITDIGDHAERFDAAITALNLHDIYNRGGDGAAIGMLEAIYNVLKPGGVFGIIDHQGRPGQDNTVLHRMLKED